MVDFSQLTYPPLVSEASDGGAGALQALLHKQSIRDLVAMHSIARDDCDVEAYVRCYLPTGSLTFGDTVLRGHDEIRTYFDVSMRRFRTTLHTMHSHLVELDGERSASGLVTAHFELSTEDSFLVGAYRYTDSYVFAPDNRWVFASRALQVMYATPVNDLASCFASGLRVRWPWTEPAVADLPESLPSWAAMNRERMSQREV